MKKTKISFDFDGTIGHKPHLQRLARELCLDPNNEVHIITRRYERPQPQFGDEAAEVYQVARQCGIRPENVHFTNRAYKLETIIRLMIQMHWDDDVKEIAMIRESSGCIPFWTT